MFPCVYIPFYLSSTYITNKKDRLNAFGTWASKRNAPPVVRLSLLSNFSSVYLDLYFHKRATVLHYILCSLYIVLQAGLTAKWNNILHLSKLFASLYARVTYIACVIIGDIVRKVVRRFSTSEIIAFNLQKTRATVLQEEPFIIQLRAHATLVICRRPVCSSILATQFRPSE